MSTRLETTIHTWATSLTQRYKLFNHEDTLTPKHFLNLTQDKHLKHIFAFMVRHIRPPEEQRLIKLNLKHNHLRKRITNDEHEVTPSEEQFRLKAAIIDTTTAVSSLTSEIQQLNEKKESLHQREVDVKRRLTMLKAVQEERQREIHHCQLWNSQLSTLLDGKCSAESKKNARMTVDMNLQRQLRGNLQDVEKLCRAVIATEVVSPELLHEQKLCVWNLVGKTMLSWDPRALLLAMICETREANRILHSQVQQVDLVRDARELRLKCESDGSFIDEMNPGGVIESVRELLGQMSVAHIKLYMEAHQADQTGMSLTRALNTLKKNIFSAAKNVYSDEGVASAVVTLIKENISLAGERAALTTAQSLAASLQHRADAAARARAALRSKHAKIASFEKEVLDGVESIQCLAVSVGEAWDTILGHLQKTGATVDGFLKHTVLPTPISRDALTNECKAFATVPLSYLLTTNIDGLVRQEKVKMSTTTLPWFDPPSLNPEGINQLCTSTYSWDGLYKLVNEKLEMTAFLSNQLDRPTSLRAGVQPAKTKALQPISSQYIKELTERVEETDKRLETGVAKYMAICENQITEGLHHVTKLEKLLQEWWEQPAKSIDLKKSIAS